MRILIIADDSFASRERAMLSRLEVGLADEGVRVVHAVPRRALQWCATELSAQTLVYEDRGLGISRSWRVQQLLAAVRNIESGRDQPLDLVHAFGDTCWDFASELARQAGAALALEVHSAQAAVLAARRRPAGAGPTVHMLPDPVLERLVRDGQTGVQVRVTPWGVHTPAATRRAVRPVRSRSVMIAGSGSDRAAMGAALEGLAALSPQHPDLMVFADESAARRSGAWAIVQRLRIADRFTLAPEMEARRELALRGDILLLPEARGEHRSLTLDAMAAGMLVIAADDPLVSVLADGKTARLVRSPSPDLWRETLSWALDEQSNAPALAASAREHVRAHCRASAHVAAVVGAYEWMTSGESIPFGPGV